MAHKLARVLWHLLQYRQEFDWNVFAQEEEKMKRKKLAGCKTWPRPSTINSCQNNDLCV